jgi:hypothetical protein
MTRTSILAVWILMSPACADACSCARVPFEERFRGASIIVAADVVSVKTRLVPQRADRTEPKVDEQTIVWRVAHTWKGPVTYDSNLTTRSRVWNGGCGLRAESGQSMVLFLPDAREGQALSLCSSGMPLSDAIDLVPELFRLSGDPAGTSQHPFRGPRGDEARISSDAEASSTTPVPDCPRQAPIGEDM